MLIEGGLGDVESRYCQSAKSLMSNMPENNEGESRAHLDRPFCCASAIV
jgi:hypothetical protein